MAYTRALPVAGAAELRTGELELVAPLETRPVSREGALPVRLVLLRAPVVLACLEAVVPLEPEGPLDAGADEDGGDAAGGFAGARGALTELDAETLGAEGGGGELTDAPAPAPAPPDLTDPLAPAEGPLGDVEALAEAELDAWVPPGALTLADAPAVLPEAVPEPDARVPPGPLTDPDAPDDPPEVPADTEPWVPPGALTPAEPPAVPPEVPADALADPPGVVTDTPPPDPLAVTVAPLPDPPGGVTDTPPAAAS